MINVMIVEDDQVFLSHLCRIVASDADLELFAAVRDGVSARQSLVRGEPDVLLVDLGLPDMSGIEVIRNARRQFAQLDIMVITIFEDEHQVMACLEAGATGYLLKEHITHDLVGEIKQLVAGGSPISPLIARLLLKRLCPPKLVKPASDEAQPSLSGRESEILALLAKGLSYAEIAGLLEISPHTVTTVVKKIYQKLAVHSRGEAVYEAGRMGLLH